MELAVRAAYLLVVSGRLNADRGSAGNAQPDRRTPGEVLDAMRRTLHGVYQLGQALEDFATDRSIRAVSEDGSIRKLDDGSDEMMVNDIYLRSEFPPPGKARAHRTGDTPADRYQNRVNALSKAIESFNEAFRHVTEVEGDDGRPLVDSRGVDSRDTIAWREVPRKIDEELVIWGRTFQRGLGPNVRVTPRHDDPATPPEMDHGATDGELDAVERWDRGASASDTEANA